MTGCSVHYTVKVLHGKLQIYGHIQIEYRHIQIYWICHAVTLWYSAPCTKRNGNDNLFTYL